MEGKSSLDGVRQLVQKYESNRDSYLNQGYKEAQLRKEFIDPLLELLGWDVENKNQYAEAYKDVVHEDALKIGGTTKAPDYCCQVAGSKKFYIEAKKPSVDIKGDREPAIQLRRYGWNKKLSLSILTNFEDFAVYDTRIPPKKTDTAATARIKIFSYKELPDNWSYLTSIFTKEAIMKGSFDRYAGETKSKRGTAEVDELFLGEIESWRDRLAHNIALRNEISAIELNRAVQATIDRIIFLRICEDRGLETYGRLKTSLQGSNTYERLKEYFRLADEKYDSGLFYFYSEKGRKSIPDTLTLNLSIDDKVLKDIINHIYYPESPYEFSVLPSDILGQVYEQFLGRVISLSPSGKAKVEEKPEVKKMGGVYYTATSSRGLHSEEFISTIA